MINKLEKEIELYKKGYKYVACIDEVGRGSLAGDVVAAAVIMPIDSVIDGVKDSKKIAPKKREKIEKEIREESIAIGIGKVSPKIIDEINIKEATRLAMKQAILNLEDKQGNKIVPDYLLIDAEIVDLDIPQESIIKGDDKIYGIASASIVAKVFRDNLCVEWDKEYPGYNFYKNKTYGTKEHREFILEKGITKIHRKSFLKKLLAMGWIESLF